MACNRVPLTTVERQHLQELETIDVLIAWAQIRNITTHPEVIEEINKRLSKVIEIPIFFITFKK